VDKQTIEAAIRWGKNKLIQADKATYLVDAEWLLAEILGCNRLDLKIRQDVLLREIDRQTYQKYIDRRVAGEPTQYILGYHIFYGYKFYVNKHVLIPRFETEELVEKVSESIQKNQWRRAMDLCSGSGCIGSTLLKEWPALTCTFVDISAEALHVAKENIESLGVLDRSHLIQSDLFEKINQEKYELIVANPPYVATHMVETLDEEVMNAEPHLALDGGVDGLDFYKKICVEAKAYLIKGGQLFFEIGYDQGEAVVQLMIQNGYEVVEKYKDLHGCDRIVKGSFTGM